jgi:hypothetical protein
VQNLIVPPDGKEVYPEEVANELPKSPYLAEAIGTGSEGGSRGSGAARFSYPNQEELEDARRGKGPMAVAGLELLIRDELLAAVRRPAGSKRVKRFIASPGRVPQDQHPEDQAFRRRGGRLHPRLTPRSPGAKVSPPAHYPSPAPCPGTMFRRSARASDA